VIAGGGIAGLATAYELHRRGRTFVVLEPSARAGGVVLSEQIDGLTIDAGPDSLLIQKPDGIKLCEELGLGDRLVAMKPPRTAYIERAGRLHPLPAASVLGVPTRFAACVQTGLISWAGKARMATELLVPRRREDSDESISSFMRRRFGREATTYLAEPLLAGIHAGDVERLSVQALFPQLADAERRHGSVLLAFRRTARAPAPEGAFKSLRGGLSELVRAIEQLLPAESLRFGVRVTGLEGRGPFRVITESGDVVEGDAVVLATPAYAAAAIFDRLDAELARLCSEIQYASSATVALAFDRRAVSHPLNGSGFVVPRVEARGIFAASWLSSKWPFRAPGDTVLLRTFVGGARDPAALDQLDAQLVKMSLDVLTPLLGITSAPRLTRVYRWHRANAQHEVGHRSRLERIERALARHPGVFVTGSGFRGVGIPDCVADGRRIAGLADQWLQRSRSPQDPHSLTSSGSSA
jgi:oxygen-dependent protoporphyrinogen oxidase